MEGRPNTLYHVEFLDPTPAVLVAWRLKKSDGTVYDVVLTEHGYSCDCPDFLRRRDGTKDGCKHVTACRSLGLFGRRGLLRSES